MGQSVSGAGAPFLKRQPDLSSGTQYRFEGKKLGKRMLVGIHDKLHTIPQAELCQNA